MGKKLSPSCSLGLLGLPPFSQRASTMPAAVLPLLMHRHRLVHRYSWVCGSPSSPCPGTAMGVKSQLGGSPRGRNGPARRTRALHCEGVKPEVSNVKESGSKARNVHSTPACSAHSEGSGSALRLPPSGSRKRRSMHMHGIARGRVSVARPEGNRRSLAWPLCPFYEGGKVSRNLASP